MLKLNFFSIWSVVFDIKGEAEDRNMHQQRKIKREARQNAHMKKYANFSFIVEEHLAPLKRTNVVWKKNCLNGISDSLNPNSQEADQLSTELRMQK